jgi:hypothetical protein
VSQCLKSAKTSKFKDGYLDYAGKRVLNVMISSTWIERCAILFDALIKEGEAEGYSWKINAEGKTVVMVKHVLDTHQTKLQEIVALMEANLEEPIDLDHLVKTWTCHA